MTGLTMAAKAPGVCSITFGTICWISREQPKNTTVPPKGGAMQDGIDVPPRPGRPVHVWSANDVSSASWRSTTWGTMWVPACLLHDEEIFAVSGVAPEMWRL